MDIESSIAIIAICLLILTLFLIVLLFCLIRLVWRLNRGVSTIKGKASLLIEEANRFIHSAHDATNDIKDKVNPLFSAMAKINLIEYIRTSEAVAKESKKKIGVLDVIEWTALAMIIWQKLKKGVKRE